MRVINFSDGYSSSSAPSAGTTAQNAFATYASIAAFVSAKGSAAANGDLFYDTTSSVVRYYRGAWRVLDIARVASDALFVTAKGAVAEDGDLYYDTALDVHKGYWNGAWITLVGLTSTQTLTGKTLTSPTINTPTITGAKCTYAAKTTTYLATLSDDVLALSSTAFTVTLPTAVGCGGKVYEFIHAGTDFVIYTIDGNASETIAGATTTTLNTNGEVLRIVSDNANWQILSRRIPSAWLSTTLTITPASLAFGTITSAAYFWRRIGDSLQVRGKFITGTVAANTMILALSTLTIDTAKVTASSTAISGSWYNLDASTGGTGIWANGKGGTVFSDGSTNSQLFLANGVSASVANTFSKDTGSGGGLTNGDAVSYEFIVPISGWNG